MTQDTVAVCSRISTWTRPSPCLASPWGTAHLLHFSMQIYLTKKRTGICIALFTKCGIHFGLLLMWGLKEIISRKVMTTFIITRGLRSASVNVKAPDMLHISYIEPSRQFWFLSFHQSHCWSKLAIQLDKSTCQQDAFTVSICETDHRSPLERGRPFTKKIECWLDDLVSHMSRVFVTALCWQSVAPLSCKIGDFSPDINLWYNKVDVISL